MNEAHFKLFILYVLDLHNLHIEKKVDLLANPLNPLRDQEIQKVNENIALRGLSHLSLEPEQTNADKVVPSESAVEVSADKATTNVVVDTVDNQVNDGFAQLENGDFSCNLCPATYKRMGNMRNHLNTKHKMSHELKCACGKVFSESTKLNRHQKTCKTALE